MSALPLAASPASPGQVPIQLDASGRHILFSYADEIDRNPSEQEVASLGASLDLGHLQLDRTTAMPGQEITISGVPMDAGKVRVAILKPDGSIFTWAMLRDSGAPRSVTLVTPLLPLAIAPLGALHLKVYVRGAVSGVLSFIPGQDEPVTPDQGAIGAVKGVAEGIDEDPLSDGATSAIVV
ncbi:MAG: hypothetical protein KGR26_17045, partial [Cyanobacteria bacterium REEB65]|nr:hypothetical protein [Cyanobacteria bacterium REEB65]